VPGCRREQVTLINRHFDAALARVRRNSIR
jgi:hypothetical protein